MVCAHGGGVRGDVTGETRRTTSGRQERVGFARGRAQPSRRHVPAVKTMTDPLSVAPAYRWCWQCSIRAVTEATVDTPGKARSRSVQSSRRIEGVNYPRPRWDPQSFEQAVADIARGDIRETAYQDFKVELGRTESIRKSLSMFANDGGVLFFGVEEDKKTQVATRAVPVLLEGAIERIHNIAGSVDPQLTLEDPLVLPDPADPSRGIIVVTVPPSPIAPHQADGKYYRRAGNISAVMTDAEVERAIRARGTWDEAAEGWLADLLEPLRKDPSHQFHEAESIVLSIAVMPRPASRELLSLTMGDLTSLWKWVGDVLKDGAEAAQALVAACPVLDRKVARETFGAYRGSSQPTRTPSGIMAKFDFDGEILTPKRRLASNESQKKLRRRGVLEIAESGAIRLTHNHLASLVGPSTDPKRCFAWQEAIGLVLASVATSHRLITQAGAAADLAVALEIQGLEGAYPVEPWDDLDGLRRDMRSSERDPYTENTFRAATLWSQQELKRAPHLPLDRMFGQLLRSMGLGNVLRKALDGIQAGTGE